MKPTKKQISNLISRAKYNDFGGILYTVIDQSDVYSETETEIFINERLLRDYLDSSEMKNKKLLKAESYDDCGLKRFKAEFKVFKKRCHKFQNYTAALKFVEQNYETLTLEF